MAEHSRSPNYPALSLQVAMIAARKLWAAEKRTALSNEAAALALGFKALSGPARVAIGSLRQYGLIDKADKGHIRISDLAMRIIHGEPSEQAAAMREAALMPDLFRDLSGTHADASEHAIRSFLLLKKGFASDGATKAARSFRETMTIVSENASGYNGTANESQDEANPAMNTGTQSPLPDGQTARVPDGALSLNVPFAKGSIAVQVRVSGQPISRAALARVRQYLQLAEEDLEPADEQ